MSLIECDLQVFFPAPCCSGWFPHIVFYQHHFHSDECCPCSTVQFTSDLCLVARLGKNICYAKDFQRVAWLRWESQGASGWIWPACAELCASGPWNSRHRRESNLVVTIITITSLAKLALKGQQNGQTSQNSWAICRSRAKNSSARILSGWSLAHIRVCKLKVAPFIIWVDSNQF